MRVVEAGSEAGEVRGEIGDLTLLLYPLSLLPPSLPPYSGSKGHW